MTRLWSFIERLQGSRFDRDEAVGVSLLVALVLGTAWVLSTMTRLQGQRSRLVALERAARAGAGSASPGRDGFLAFVSHELRNSLTATVAWVYRLKTSTMDPPEMRRAIEAIERNALFQAKLVDDLLDASRMLVGKFDLSMRRLDISDVVQHAVDSLHPKADATGVALPTTTSPGLWVLGDAARLQQVVTNVVSNAIGFTPRGGEVRVDVRRRGALVELVVRDTGEGIDPVTLPHVFELFHQGPSLMPRRGGLGVGLAIARHIVDLHGGSIAAHSAGLGHGATFTVRLPLTA